MRSSTPKPRPNEHSIVGAIALAIGLITLVLLTACGGGDVGDQSDTGPARVDTPTVDCSTGACK